MTRDRTISRSSSPLAYAVLATMILSLRAFINKVCALVSSMELLRSIPFYNSGRIMRIDRVRSGQWTSALPGSDRQVLAERYVRLGPNPEVRRRMPTDPAVSRPNSTSILTVQCNGAVVRSHGYTNPIYTPAELRFCIAAIRRSTSSWASIERKA